MNSKHLPRSRPSQSRRFFWLPGGGKRRGKTPSQKFKPFLAAALFILPVAFLQAGEVQTFVPTVPVAAGPNKMSHTKISLTSTYAAAGDVTFDDTERGDSESVSVALDISTQVPLGEIFFVPIAFGSDNIFLNSVEGVPIPNNINTLSFGTGVGVRLSDQWTAAIIANALLYNLEDVGSNSLGFSAMLRAEYAISTDFVWLFGVAFQSDSDLPVLPVAGLRWNLQEDLTLSLVFPKPELLYRVTPEINVFLTGSFETITFRADDSLSEDAGVAGFDNALGNYREISAGIGAEYLVSRSFTIRLEGGYVIDRNLDYDRVGKDIEFDSAPYARLALKFGF